ncbi:MAG: hypothetical protein K6C05_09935 [Anaerovibrio sp.]|uniref:hypothetical protein n=1 Tax=Anaerovibrio sp. TaxID=1872532 RepID=UPI0025E5CEBE|nr:hypothetical protein [Anaerovibrio sp.]MCR5177153.1 hypothetical protein [Anaerovibrio sp.]
MNLDNLKAVRQSKGYSIDMMAEFMEESREAYLELEYSVREATEDEMLILQSIFPECSD